ncbi:MAG TPA: NAD(P)/FAD-dependent oxidoreductase [Verrucomicrobiae bacterium]|nr:NAD(P)/FAD-dependent oxidoreductase [Verrucomicrobiae bacterium]
MAVSKQNYKDYEKKNIVILGGGFAGVRAALDLAEYLRDDPEYEIILIDRKDYQLYNAALYEAATAEHGLVEAKKVKTTVAIPFSKIFRNTKVKVYKAYIDSVNLDGGMVVTDSRIINYNYLIVALGSVPDFYGIPSIEKYGFTLKSLEDAIMIRNRIEELVSKRDKAQIVIGGGGFSGAEFAGELHNLLQHECKHHQKNPENFGITIVEGSTTLLSGLPSNISKMVVDRLTNLGIKMIFSTLVTEASGSSIMLNNKEKIDCDLLVWTGGVKSCRMPGNIDIDRDRKDRIPSTEYLNLKKLPNVFIAGDNLCFNDLITKKPLPQTAQEAIRQAKCVAKNVYRMIKGKSLLPYFPGTFRYVIPVAGKHAIFYSKDIVIGGSVGWLIRRLADLKYFLSVLPFFSALGFWMFENEIFIKND